MFSQIDQQRLEECVSLMSKNELFKARGLPVGALLVKDGQVLYEGLRKYFLSKGEHFNRQLFHAEQWIIYQARLDERDLRGSTLYVTLEPCTFRGNPNNGRCYSFNNTPCVELIMQSGIQRVVIGVRDQNEEINGAGIDFLREQGIEVDVAEDYDLEIAKQLQEFYKREQENALKQKTLRRLKNRQGVAKRKRRKTSQHALKIQLARADEILNSYEH